MCTLRTIFAAALLLGILSGTAAAARVVTRIPAMISIPDLQPSPRQRAARSALREISLAQSAVSRSVSEQVRDFESSPEWQQALEHARTTRQAYQQARAETIAQYHQTPQYRQAQIEIYKLQESLDLARHDPNKNRQRIIDLAHQLLERRSALTKVESEMIAADDSLREARYAMIDADSEVKSLRENFENSIRSDPDWRSAKRQLDTAHQRLADLRRS